MEYLQEIQYTHAAISLNIGVQGSVSPSDMYRLGAGRIVYEH